MVLIDCIDVITVYLCTIIVKCWDFKSFTNYHKLLINFSVLKTVITTKQI